MRGDFTKAPTLSKSAAGHPAFAARLKAHVAIARLDHSIKNVFVLPGIVVPMSMARIPLDSTLILHLLYGFVAVTLITCSNYVLNEILDAPFDRFHPTKKFRPAACGLVSIRAAYAQWIFMMAGGLLIASFVSWQFATAAALWIMGCLYNVPPVRTKDVPYLDALSESVNNPLRMLQGWYMVTTVLIPPVSLLLAYWMVGAYFMALKRFSEYRQLGNPLLAAAYRKSFRYYTETSLLVSVTFYASAAMLFFGAFIMRYRVEMILSFPFVALVMAIYFRLAFEHERYPKSGKAVSRAAPYWGGSCLFSSDGFPAADRCAPHASYVCPHSMMWMVVIERTAGRV